MQMSQVGSEADVGSQAVSSHIMRHLEAEGLVGFFAPRSEADQMLKDLKEAGVRPEYSGEFGCYVAPAGSLPDPHHTGIQRYLGGTDAYSRWSKDREDQAYLEAVCFGAAEEISRQPEMAVVRKDAADSLNAKTASEPDRSAGRSVSDEEVALAARATAASKEGLKLVAAYIRNGLLLAGERNVARRDQQLKQIAAASREEITEVLDRTTKRFQALDNKEKFERFNYAIENHLPEVLNLARGIDSDPAFQEKITFAAENMNTSRKQEALFTLRGAFMRLEFHDQKRLGGNIALDPSDKMAMDSLRRGFNALEQSHVSRFGMPSGFRLTTGRAEGGVYKAALQKDAPSGTADGKSADEKPAEEQGRLSRLQMRRRLMEQNSVGM